MKTCMSTAIISCTWLQQLSSDKMSKRCGCGEQERGIVRFLPPGLLCRWAWHTGLRSPDSQISSPLAQWSWAANPPPPVSELPCSANDRGFKKKIKFDAADKTNRDYDGVAFFPCPRAGFADLIQYFTACLERAACLTSGPVRLAINEKSPMVSKCNSLRFGRYILNVARPQGREGAF